MGGTVFKNKVLCSPPKNTRFLESSQGMTRTEEPVAAQCCGCCEWPRRPSSVCDHPRGPSSRRASQGPGAEWSGPALLPPSRGARLPHEAPRIELCTHPQHSAGLPRPDPETKDSGTSPRNPHHALRPHAGSSHPAKPISGDNDGEEEEEAWVPHSGRQKRRQRGRRSCRVSWVTRRG